MNFVVTFHGMDVLLFSPWHGIFAENVVNFKNDESKGPGSAIYCYLTKKL